MIFSEGSFIDRTQCDDDDSTGKKEEDDLKAGFQVIDHLEMFVHWLDENKSDFYILAYNNKIVSDIFLHSFIVFKWIWIWNDSVLLNIYTRWHNIFLLNSIYKSVSNANFHFCYFFVPFVCIYFYKHFHFSFVHERKDNSIRSMKITRVTFIKGHK